MKIISFISQSGNVMKTTLANAMALECVNNNYESAIADLDVEHRTTANWMRQREEFEIFPQLPVYEVNSALESLECFNDEHICIIDAPSRATEATKIISLNSDLIVQPTPPSKKDIDLALNTFYQLASDGVDPKKMIIVLTRVGSDAELQRAIDYIALAKINNKPIRVLSSAMWEKVAYRSAINDGYAITETSYTSLNDKAKAVIHQILTFLI